MLDTELRDVRRGGWPEHARTNERSLPDHIGPIPAKAYELDPDARRKLVEGLLAEQSIEDGVSHPAEAALREWILCDVTAGRAIAALIHRHSDRGVAGDLLIAVARVRLSHGRPWLRDILRMALSDPHLSLRYAAVKAIELLGDPELLRMLIGFRPAEPWFAAYVYKLCASQP